MTKRLVSWFIGLVIASLYVYAAVVGVGNFIGMWGIGDALGTGLSVAGWVWLSIGIALPIVVFALALLFAAGRGVGIRILMLAAGLAVVAVLQIDLMHLVPQSSYFA